MRLTRRLGSVALSAVLLSLTACPGMSQFMRMYGYVELKPPSTLLAPGAMVAVVSRSPYVAKIICGPRASLGAGWKPIESDTASSTLKKQNSKTFHLDADVMSQITANVQFQYISDITVTLTNARIVELQDTDVYENMRFRSGECEAALEGRRRAGFEVSMISSGLMGDVQYNVSWNMNTTLDAKGKVDALSNLAIQLGGGANCVSDTTIAAKNLMYGIKDDIYLAAISLPDVDENRVKRGSRILDRDAAPTIDVVPEAPVVQPTSGQGGEPEYCDSATCPNGLKKVVGNPQLETQRRQ